MARSSLDRLTEASRRLDPASRALLDLWLVRDLDDHAIARMIGSSGDSVEARRQAVLEQLAGEVEAPVDEVRDGLRHLARAGGGKEPETAARAAAPPFPAPPAAAPDAHRSRRDPGVTNGPVAAAGGEAAASRETHHGRAPRTRRGPGARRAALALAVAAVVAVLVAALALALDPGEKTPRPRVVSGSTALRLQLLPGQPLGARASGALSPDGRLRLRVSGLPPRASYVLWLLNSLIDSRPVARLRGPTATVDVRLPATRARYGFLDLSLEPDDGNPSHSGRSVLRTALAR